MTAVSATRVSRAPAVLDGVGPQGVCGEDERGRPAGALVDDAFQVSGIDVGMMRQHQRPRLVVVEPEVGCT